jgi:hypothetical protein
MILAIKCLRDFYEKGYWDGICFSYIPEFSSAQEKAAYAEGYKDAKENKSISETKYL